MKVRHILIAAAAAVTGSLLAGAAASAQGLADVARKEEERRKSMGKATATKSGKVYTNDNLNPDFTVPPTPPAPEAGGTPAAADPAARPADPANPGTNITPVNINDRGEKYFRDKATNLRAAMDQAQMRIRSLQGRINLVQNDPAELKLNQGLLQSAQAELKSLEEEQQNFLALAKLQKVPEAWLQP